MRFRSRKELFLVSAYATALVFGAAVTLYSTGGVDAYNVGKVFGVWLLTALVFQLVLATRADFIESGIGYDRLTGWHSFNGKMTVILVLLHPLTVLSPQLLNAEYSAVIGFLVGNPATLLGVAALLLVLGQVAGALYGTFIDYQLWRRLHMTGYVIVLLGILHSFFLGTDTALPPVNMLGYWWLFLAATALVAAFYSLFYRRFRERSRFRVAEVKQEAPEVTTVEFEPLQEDMSHRPGQFAYVIFNSDNVPAEEHHFTISSEAGREGVSLTIKSVGDFTSRIPELESGDTARLEGPYGSFTMEGVKGPYTFIAGGIGITPLMSMIRTMADSSGEKTRLIYGSKTREDIIFREELRELENSEDWLDVEHVLSEEDAEGFRHGYIDRKVLEELLLEGSTVFLCGPPAMMDSVLDSLQEMNIPPERIRFERFSLRD